MPLYVRGGAILPSGPDLHYTDEYSLDPLTLDLYPDSGAFTLYEDDGYSFEYERGQFCTSNYTLRRTEKQLIFEIGAREGAYVPPTRRLLIKIHDVDEQAAQGHPSASYDPVRRLLTLQEDDEGSAKMLSFKMGS
jgi:alpha-glucosidase